jgi:release factor glutamine methyltransferase
VLTVPGVYPPQGDSYLLAAALRREQVCPGMDVLDLCAGSGALGLYAARLGARVTAVDIGRRAVLTTRLNALLSRQRLTVRRSDLMTALPSHSFDVIVSNPPYLPSPEGSLPRRGAARAWDAGHNGRALVDRICDGAPTMLRPHGVLLMVHSGLCGPATTLRRLSEAGMRATISDRAYIDLGPVLRGRLSWLRERGLMDPSEEKEELVIIRAVKI